MSRLSSYREAVVDTGYDFIKSRVLQAAFELDIFERLGTHSKTALTLAEELKADLRTLGLFLNALVSLGFLEAEGSGYQNAKFGQEIFLKGKPLYVGDYIKLHSSGFEDWVKLGKSVLSGKPVDRIDFFKIDNSKMAVGFARAMRDTAMGHAELLAGKFSFRGAKILLDLGGGPGTFTIYFLKANPELRATIFDLPQTLETTRKFVSEAGLTDRVDFQAGDFNQDEIQGKFDVCFLSHIIHGQNEEKNRNLFKKAFAVLNAGGRFIVQDFFLNSDKQSPQFSALFALMMLLYTEGGRTYTFEEAEDWMRSAGFSRMSRSQLKLPRSMSLLVGEKQ